MSDEVKPTGIFRVELYQDAPWFSGYKALPQDFATRADAEFVANYFRLIKQRDARWLEVAPQPAGGASGN